MKNSILLTLLFIMFVSGQQNVFAVPEAPTEEEIPTEGDWDEGFKSLSLSFLFEVDITGSVLTISSNTLGSDMTVRISQNNVTLLEQTIPSSETGCITIDLSNFEGGNYFLELTNQWGGYLYGSFSIE